MPKKLAKAMYDSPLPLFSFDDYERRCNECAVELNAHIKHALTCTKSKVGKVQCRLCYDQAIQEAKTGPALLAEDGTQLNGYSSDGNHEPIPRRLLYPISEWGSMLRPLPPRDYRIIYYNPEIQAS